MEDEKYIAVFASYSHTAFLHSRLLELNIPSEIIATPYKLSIGCTKSVLFNAKDLKRVKNVIRVNSLMERGIYEKVLYKNQITYILI